MWTRQRFVGGSAGDCGLFKWWGLSVAYAVSLNDGILAVSLNVVYSSQRKLVSVTVSENDVVGYNRLLTLNLFTYVYIMNHQLIISCYIIL